MEKPNSILRNNRAPRSKDNLEVKVRQSLLSNSTSGIEKGEEEETSSVDDSSFSSNDIEVSNKEQDVKKSYNYELNDDKSFIEFERKGIKTIAVKIIESPANRTIELESIKTANNATVNEDTNRKIPDGGWGWVVVLSSFVISMIADGISFSFGLLYMEFLDEFQASKSTTAWIGSLFIAVPLLSGPVMSVLVDKYGCRSMTILGGIISSLGFVLASISTTLEMMMITFGVIAGLGLGLVYVTAVVSIAYWFDKKRNLAVGLGACGTGVGTFVYAPMTQYFIEEYGWRGTILLLSGTLLNLCVCGCVMRDPEWWTEQQKLEVIKKDDNKAKKDSLNFSSPLSDTTSYVFDSDNHCRGKSMKGLIKRGMSSEKVIAHEAAFIRRRQNMLMLKKKYHTKRLKSASITNIPTYLIHSDKASLALLESIVKSTSNNDISANFPQFLIKQNELRVKQKNLNEGNDDPIVTCTQHIIQRSKSEECDYKKEKALENQQLKNPKSGRIFTKANSETKDETLVLIKQESKVDKREWFKRQLSINHHYLRDLKMPKNSISHRNAMLNIKKYRLKASSCPDIFKNSMITINDKEEKWYIDGLNYVSDMFNIALLKKMTFNLLCLSTIILFIWFIVPYFYLAEHMVHKGYSEDDGAVMLSLIGITNTIGMVGLGWIGDFPNVSVWNLYAVCQVLCGATVAAIPIAVTHYWLLATVSSAFGLLFAASFTFTPSLLVKLVSLEDFTSAYGLVLLAEGIGHLIGPPLSGLIYDLTYSWELSFYLAGGWIIVAGVMVSFIQPIRMYQKRRDRKIENCSESSMA